MWRCHLCIKAFYAPSSKKKKSAELLSSTNFFLYSTPSWLNNFICLANYWLWSNCSSELVWPLLLTIPSNTRTTLHRNMCQVNLRSMPSPPQFPSSRVHNFKLFALPLISTSPSSLWLLIPLHIFIGAWCMCVHLYMACEPLVPLAHVLWHLPEFKLLRDWCALVGPMFNTIPFWAISVKVMMISFAIFHNQPTKVSNIYNRHHLRGS